MGYVGQVLNPTFSSAPSAGPREPKDKAKQRLDRRKAEISLQRAEADDDDDVDGNSLERVASASQRDTPEGELVGQGTTGTTPMDEAAGDEAAAEAGPSQSPLAALGPEELRGCITLIARMAADRSGTRLWRKGLDMQVRTNVYLLELTFIRERSTTVLMYDIVFECPPKFPTTGKQCPYDRGGTSLDN